MIEHAHKDVCFLLSCSNEAYSGSMVDNRERECDALWGWLRGVVEEGYPAVLLGKELMSREERSRVSIRSHSKKNQIKDGEAGGILLGKFADELFFVSIGKLLQIVEKRRIDGMDVGLRDRDVGKQMGGARRVIGIGVIKGYRTLIDIEDLPKERSSGNHPDVGGRYIPFVPFDQRVIDKTAERFREGTSRESNGEFTLLF